MSYKVFIDGAEGTTGLQLKTRLSAHGGVSLIEIDPALRKDPEERKKLINRSDVTFLCLPDQAAEEAVGLVENPETVIIDASTAHRTSPGWAYGFAELSEGHRRAIAEGKRIANPGCHATGFIAAVYPLIALGIAGRDYPFTCHSVTGTGPRWRFMRGWKKRFCGRGRTRRSRRGRRRYPLRTGICSPARRSCR